MALKIRPYTYVAEAEPNDGHQYHLTVCAPDRVNVWSSHDKRFVENEGSCFWPSLEAALDAANAHHDNARHFAARGEVAAASAAGKGE